jgi:hypothetical protein
VRDGKLIEPGCSTPFVYIGFSEHQVLTAKKSQSNERSRVLYQFDINALPSKVKRDFSGYAKWDYYPLKEVTQRRVL